MLWINLLCPCQACLPNAQGRHVLQADAARGAKLSVPSMGTPTSMASRADAVPSYSRCALLLRPEALQPLKSCCRSQGTKVCGKPARPAPRHRQRISLARLRQFWTAGWPAGPAGVQPAAQPGRAVLHRAPRTCCVAHLWAELQGWALAAVSYQRAAQPATVGPVCYDCLASCTCGQSHAHSPAPTEQRLPACARPTCCSLAATAAAE